MTNISFVLLGGLKRDKGGVHTWASTCSSNSISLAAAREASLDLHMFTGFNSFAMSNGDVCSLDSWVIIHSNRESLVVGRVIEILQAVGSPSEFSKHPDIILVTLYETGPLAETYKLPILLKSNSYAIVPFLVGLSF